MNKITTELISKINKIFLIVVGSLTTLYMFLLMTGNLEKGETEEGIKTFSGSIVDYTSHLYVFVFIVLLIAVLSVFGFAVAQIFSDVNKLKTILVSVLLPGIVIFFLAYFMSSSTPVKLVSGLTTESESKWSEVGIIIFYILFLLAVVMAFVGPQINKLIKK